MRNAVAITLLLAASALAAPAPLERAVRPRAAPLPVGVWRGRVANADLKVWLYEDGHCRQIITLRDVSDYDIGTWRQDGGLVTYRSRTGATSFVREFRWDGGLTAIVVKEWPLERSE